MRATQPAAAKQGDAKTRKRVPIAPLTPKAHPDPIPGAPNRARQRWCTASPACSWNSPAGRGTFVGRQKEPRAPGIGHRPKNLVVAAGNSDGKSSQDTLPEMTQDLPRMFVGPRDSQTGSAPSWPCRYVRAAIPGRRRRGQRPAVTLPMLCAERLCKQARRRHTLTADRCDAPKHAFPGDEGVLHSHVTTGGSWSAQARMENSPCLGILKACFGNNPLPPPTPAADCT